MTYLLQPSVARLAPDIIAVYIHAATKVFGHWASEMAEQWQDSMLTEMKTMVDTVIERVGHLSTSPHIEVQERVCGRGFALEGLILLTMKFRQRTLCSCLLSSRGISVPIVPKRPTRMRKKPAHHHSILSRNRTSPRACILYGPSSIHMSSTRLLVLRKRAFLCRKD